MRNTRNCSTGTNSATKASNPSLPKAASISAPVVLSCTSGCWIVKLKRKETIAFSSDFLSLGNSTFIPFATRRKDEFSAIGLIILRRSTLIVSQATITTLYPLAAPTHESPIPVFPLVASTIVAPVLGIPSCSAFSIMLKQYDLFTEEPGLNASSFTPDICSTFWH